MEWCHSLATSFAKPINRWACICCEPYAEDHKTTQFVEKYSSVSAIGKSREENSDVRLQTIQTLLNHYEAQFYEHLQQKPKIVTPILLYHSYNAVKDYSSEKPCQNLKNCDSNDLVNLQLQFSNTISSETGEHDVLEELTPPVTNGETQTIDTERIRSFESNKFQELKNYSHDDVHLLSNMKQSERISMTSNLNQNLYSEYHRSAFSKPHRFQERELCSANTVVRETNSCVDDFVKGQCSFENSGRHNFQTRCCSFQHSLVNPCNDFKSETPTKIQRDSLAYYGSQSLMPSCYSQSCLRDNYLVDWGQYLYYSSLLETCQSSIFAHDGLYSRTYGLNIPATESHFVDCQSPFSVNGKQLECRGSHPESVLPQFYNWPCRSVFSSKPQIKVPSAEKLHKCDCGREFARKEELTRHMRIRSGHRPFRCSVCGKTFGRKDHLNKHRTTHLHTSEKKVHVCVTEGCLQRYTRSDALARHQWAAHGIRARASKWRPHL